MLEKYQLKQTRDSTTENYLSIWRQFNRFLISLDDKGSLGSWESKVALFGAYLVDQVVQSSTLRSYISAIKHVLRNDGYQWNDEIVRLNSLIKGCKFVNDTLKIRLPISRNLLEFLLFEIERQYPKQPYLEIMYKAVFALLYYGMLRVGEISVGPHVIKACNVHVATNKNKILLMLYMSKTHSQANKLQEIKITQLEEDQMKSTQSILQFCPFRLTRAYLNVRGNYLDKGEQFLVFSHRSPV